MPQLGQGPRPPPKAPPGFGPKIDKKAEARQAEEAAAAERAAAYSIRFDREEDEKVRRAIEDAMANSTLRPQKRLLHWTRRIVMLTLSCSTFTVHRSWVRMPTADTAK